MKLILLILRIAKRFSKDDMTNYAGSVSFWLIISSVPFLMLVLGIISHVPGLDRATVTEMIYSALPDMMLLHELVDSVLSNIYIDSAGAVISLSAVLTLWSASSGIYRLETAITKINHQPRRRSYVLRRAEALLYTIFFIIALILSLLLVVLGNALGELVIRHLPRITGLVMIFLDFKAIITTGILFIFMLCIYRFMPGLSDDDGRPVLPGAVIATLGWVLASYGFSFYFTYFKNISYMYGSLGAIILLMFWLFAIICIILMGAEINAELDALNLNTLKSLRAFLAKEPPKQS